MHPPGAPTFGAPYQPSGFAQPAPGAWNPQPVHNDDRHGNKAAKDPLLAVIKCAIEYQVIVPPWREPSAQPTRYYCCRWLKARNQREKTYLGIAGGVLVRHTQLPAPLVSSDCCLISHSCPDPQLLILLYFVVEDHDNLFVMSETVHFAGIGALAYKLLRKRNCGGLSLRTQELTAVFLLVRMFCSFMMEYDIHTLLDLLTLAATGWVVYMLRGPLKGSYQADMDSVNPLLVLLPCLGLAVIAHPSTRHNIVFRVLWAFCVYLEAVSVLPQLRMMQRAKVGSGPGPAFPGE